jgi:selenocysteine lyase/cysteine desulfurase
MLFHPRVQALSYYKIFGYPTGLGALLVRRDAVQVLRKRFFGGGTVEVSVSNADFFRCQLPPAAPETAALHGCTVKC